MTSLCRIALPLAFAALAVSACQNKGATAVVPVVLTPYAAPPVSVSPAPGANNGRNGAAVGATPVAATAMNPAMTGANAGMQPRAVATPLAAYNLANMPVAATPIIAVPTMVAPSPVPVAAPAPAPAPAAQMATPVMMMAPAPMVAPAGGQVMMMIMPAQAAAAMQPTVSQPVAAQPVASQPVASQPPQQLMTLPSYGAPVYLMPSSR